MRLPLLMAAILSVSVSASAEPILYTFTASLTVSKRNADIPQQPLSAFDDAFWFPTLHDGQTYAADGWRNATRRCSRSVDLAWLVRTWFLFTWGCGHFRLTARWGSSQEMRRSPRPATQGPSRHEPRRKIGGL